MRTTTANDCFEALGSAISFARMLQFGESMFPIGGFSFSCALESAVQKGVVTDASTLRAFTLTAVEQAARGDGIAVIAAHRAASAGDVDALIHIDGEVYARKLSDEARLMSVRMGKRFTEMGAQVIGAPLLRKWLECIDASVVMGCYPVALGMNFAIQNLTAQQAFVVLQYGTASTILSAALRLMKISHVETQRILFDLSGLTEAAYESAARAHLSSMASYAPLAEILAAIHTKAHVRLFMS
ncbi:urease accessory protein UreF [Steroidobacter agaridevorans]|nr:urease accessory protein UreF [Steroidobacter agaridevorans]